MGQDHRINTDAQQVIRGHLAAERARARQRVSAGRSPTVPDYSAAFPLDAVEGQIALGPGTGFPKIPYYYTALDGWQPIGGGSVSYKRATYYCSPGVTGLAGGSDGGVIVTWDGENFADGGGSVPGAEILDITTDPTGGFPLQDGLYSFGCIIDVNDDMTEGAQFLGEMSALGPNQMGDCKMSLVASAYPDVPGALTRLRPSLNLVCPLTDLIPSEPITVGIINYDSIDHVFSCYMFVEFIQGAIAL